MAGSSGTVTVIPSPGGTVLKVMACKAGWTDSIVHSATFYYESEGGGPSPTVAPTATATATPTATATATATATPTATPTATATATPASQVSTPAFNPDGGTWFITQQRTVTVTTSTMGANMRYTINGAPPTSTTGTPISGPVNVTPSPQGTTLRVIAYKAGMIDSQVHEAVFYYENDNGGNSNMAQPVDGGPGGGGVLIDGGGQPTISYDANGNLTKYKEWNYRYDAQDRLTAAWNGTTTAQFYYDGKNRQIARNINGVIRFNSWDGWELLEEYSSSVNVVTGYLQGSTGVVKSWSAANTLYYYQDKLGSTTHVANASGQWVESYKYDLYGTPTFLSTSQPPQPLNQSAYNVADLYAGERWIPELTLYDLRNRFMSPELGRFLQPDPIGFKDDASNLYRYCGNDPVDRTDPTGLIDMWGYLRSWFMGVGRSFFESEQDRHRTGSAKDGDAQTKGQSSRAPVVKKSVGAYKSLMKWTRKVQSAAVMTSEFVTGKGPADSEFGPDSAESEDLRSDPKYWAALEKAKQNRSKTAHANFGLSGLLSAGAHPTRQFVGSYDVSISDDGVPYISNTTSIWSGLGHASFLPSSGIERPALGGNTRQIYIMESTGSE